jgi:hypothetical protein
MRAAHMLWSDHRRPSGAKGLYLVPELWLCGTPCADFGERPFHALG